MKTDTVRNSNIEVLRFVLMVAILLWHVIMHGYNFKEIGTENFVYHANIPLTLFFAALLSPATYCFVFISGFFGIHFRLGKLVQIILWCILVSLVQTVIQIYCLGAHESVKELFHAFFPITSQRWWFMTAFVQLYIIAPILNSWVKSVAKNNFKIILICLFLLSFLHIITGSLNAGSSLVGLIFVYLLGRYFNMYGTWNRIKFWKSYLCSLCILCFLLFACFYSLHMVNHEKALKVILYLLGFINPLIVMMAACIFFIVYQLPIWKNKFINRLVSANLFIYLFTEGMGGQIYTFLANEFSKNFFLGLFFLFTTLVVCIFGGLVIEKITDLILKIPVLPLVKKFNPYR